MPDEFSEEAASDLRNYEDQPSTTEAVTLPPQLPAHKCRAIDPDLAKLAFFLVNIVTVYQVQRHMPLSPAKWCINRLPMLRKF